jgi:hypothetical protein
MRSSALSARTASWKCTNRRRARQRRCTLRRRASPHARRADQRGQRNGQGRQAFFERFFEPFLEPTCFGTLPPSARASDNPIAIACVRLFTFFFERPDLPCRNPSRYPVNFGELLDAIATLRCASRAFVDGQIARHSPSKPSAALSASERESAKPPSSPSEREKDPLRALADPNQVWNCRKNSKF